MTPTTMLNHANQPGSIAVRRTVAAVAHATREPTTAEATQIM